MAEAKELKEVLKVVAVSGAFVGRRLKDGPDIGDLLAIPAWAAKNAGTIQAGVQGIDKVDDEVKMLADDKEAREDLAVFVLQEIVPIILSELKG